MLVQILAPHFTAGVDFGWTNESESRVIKAAPIVKYMIGWKIREVVDYCNKKCWKADVIPERNE